MKDAIASAFQVAQATLDKFVSDQENLTRLDQLSVTISDIFDKGGKVLICGNGGSHADALHFAEEFTGRFCKDRRALPALALGEATHVTCTSNDYGFDDIFSRGVEAFGKKGDLLIGLSTSGNSANILKALESARKLDMLTAAFTGKDGGKMKGFCDFEWIVEGKTSDRIQEVHMTALHILIEAVERRLFPELY